MNRLRHPFIIDIEASGLGSGSYPIEIGLALQEGQRFCTLVRPARAWTHWDKRAEAIHGISQECLLEHDRPVTEVALELNRLLEGKVVYSDAWGLDNSWMIELFATAGIYQRFTVSPLELILSEEQIDIWATVRDEVAQETGLDRHRATNDAWILQNTYLKTLEMTT